ncbi:hypothetical protein BKH46_08065 [Helicobacter sp. 12S02634-8]|uniref:UvrD-helicase domain-containing protein n=1 Tax=Helicobacter sp. 12S02634-8 TaxID=1476199 RepID=UPI000BA61C9F|nr:UvrD-helicase domain-containing protein [Helicobacter sp. 12S02634-8]PAF46332.1 hypothetical protein BKH46_08065 [Helicobacter sp. 12S02634-8]
MDLTAEQKNIVASQDKILLVNAYAGTGKTSTLVEYCRARVGSKILYLAYNASMAKEALKKFRGLEVDSTTIHALAYRHIGKDFQERLGDNLSLKPIDLIRYFPQDYESANALLAVFKSFLFSKETINAVMEQNKELDKNILKYLPILWKDIQCDSSLPFEHDFYLKMYQLSSPVLDYDYILVDEAQDLNPMMLDIVIKQKARLVFIGDTFQKIYGFRECINALESLASYEGARTLYLTETFRCPQNIIALANPYLALLRAEKPLVSKKIVPKEELRKKQAQCIICRTNAKVLEFVSDNLDKKIHFIGGVKGYGFDDLIDLMLVLSKNPELKRNIKNPFYKKAFVDSESLMGYIKESKDSEIRGKLILLFKLLKDEINPFELIKNIKDSPKKDADFIITSAHKSKGLEWEHVLLYDDFFDVADSLEKEEKLVDAEELNLLYVAITRAKESLEMVKDYSISWELFQKAQQNLVITKT